MNKWLEKIKLGILFLFLLLIPTQLGKHFWFDWSNVMGLRIDYLSPVLYLIDILIVIILIFDLNSIKNKIIKNNLLIIIFWFIFLLINWIFSINKYISAYKILKIIEFLFLFFYIKNNKELIIEYLKKILPIWIVFESLLGLFQLLNNGSIQGFFYWFGERRFFLNTLGIAKWTFFDEEILRVYGTFSHPNSMAGFLLVSLILWIYLVKERSGINLIIRILGFLGILMTGSRTIILMTLVYFIWNVYRNNSKSNFNSIFKKIFYIFIGVLLIFLFINVFSGWDSESWSKRWNLMISAFSMFLNYPIFGVGAGNFLSQLPKYQEEYKIFWIQPVHNIFVLWLVEFGLVGLFWLGFLISKIKFNRNNIFFVLFLIIILSGMSDHYWLTLQQNNLLFILILGLM